MILNPFFLASADQAVHRHRPRNAEDPRAAVGWLSGRGHCAEQHLPDGGEAMGLPAQPTQGGGEVPRRELIMELVFCPYL